jgi:hypothetical protein
MGWSLRPELVRVKEKNKKIIDSTWLGKKPRSTGIKPE